jgi:hypothetical protein
LFRGEFTQKHLTGFAILFRSHHIPTGNVLCTRRRCPLHGRLHLGRPEEALRWYQSVHYYPESVRAGRSHLRQGEIHEQLGRREQAIEQYRRFVDLWRDCDPEFRPLVEQARAALSRLGAS